MAVLILNLPYGQTQFLYSLGLNCLLRQATCHILDLAEEVALIPLKWHSRLGAKKIIFF